MWFLADCCEMQRGGPRPQTVDTKILEIQT